MAHIEHQLLIDLGLSDTEAKVYLGALEVGEGSVLSIAKASGVKRPTCYVVLETLKERSFVSKFEKNNVVHYAAEDPQMIMKDFEGKLAEFKDLLPFYRAKLNTGTKPKIYFYEGAQEIEKIYKYRAVNDKTNFVYAFGTDVAKMNEVFPTLFEFWEKHYFGKLETKEIVSTDKAGERYAKESCHKRPIKIMPPDLPVHADTMITDTHIFIVSLEKLFGVLIESKDLADTYKNFFLLAWQSAHEPKA